MKVSELIDNLKSRSQDAEVLIVNTDALSGSMLVLDSAVQIDKANWVIVTAHFKEPLPEFVPPKNWKHVVEARKSGTDGKHELLVDGEVRISGIETEHDAELCTRVFVEGIKEGTGVTQRLSSTNPNTAFPRA